MNAFCHLGVYDVRGRDSLRDFVQEKLAEGFAHRDRGITNFGQDCLPWNLLIRKEFVDQFVWQEDMESLREFPKLFSRRVGRKGLNDVLVDYE